MHRRTYDSGGMKSSLILCIWLICLDSRQCDTTSFAGGRSFSLFLLECLHQCLLLTVNTELIILKLHSEFPYHQYSSSEGTNLFQLCLLSILSNIQTSNSMWHHTSL